MKKLFLTGAMLLAMAGGLFAQGKFALNNGNDSNGISMTTPGNWYSGTWSVEVWLYAASGTAPASFATTIGNDDLAAGGGVTAYTWMKTQVAFTAPEATLVGLNIPAVDEGIMSGGAVTMNDDANGGLVTVALAAWNNSQPSWAAMLANATAATRAGVVAFNQNTLTGNSGTPAIAGMNTYDLVLQTVPEPGTFALAGLGAAALVIFRRRK